jgi:hypothetical protein
MVVVGDRAIPSIPFRYVRWRQAGEIAAKNPDALRLSRKEWSAAEVGDPWDFKVSEESAAHQVVSLRARSMMYGADTRYRVEGNRITPLGYKSDGRRDVPPDVADTRVHPLAVACVACRTRYQPNDFEEAPCRNLRTSIRTTSAVWRSRTWTGSTATFRTIS